MSRRTTRFTRRLPKPGTRSNGVLGDVNLAFRLGWYLTPWGYLLVKQLNKDVIHMLCISFNASQIVERYNNRMSTERPEEDVPLSWHCHKHNGLESVKGIC